MNKTRQHETIVVGVDGSAASTAAVRWAAAEASRRGSRLHAVRVVEHGPAAEMSPERDIRLELDLARQTVPGRVGGWVFDAGIEVDIAVSIVTGDVADQLARAAGDASCVVIGAPGALQHSGLPAKLACSCLCPVAVVGAFGDVTFVDAPVQPRRQEARHART
jgi:nucleotide-binding universal stress UspA family protein